MLRYAITSRVVLAEAEAERGRKLIALATKWSASNIDFIQIRESDLAIPDLIRLATGVVRAVRENGSHTRVLINAKPEIVTAIALESAADGVHYPGGLHPEQLAEAIAETRKIWQTNGGSPTISVSCHSIDEVHAARAAGATLALFAPVFEKVLPGSPPLAGQGLQALKEACAVARSPAEFPELPIVALGGVTFENASECTAAGVAGIAGIRLFLKDGER